MAVNKRRDVNPSPGPEGLIHPAAEDAVVNRRHLLKTIVGFAAAAGVFAVLFWLADVGTVYRAMVGANPWLLAVVAALILAWIGAWGLALWQVLQALELSVSAPLAVQIHAAAVFVNHVTPFGQAGGEPITALLVSRRLDAEYEVGLASITSLDAINVVPSLAFAGTGASIVALASGDGPLRDFAIAILAALTVAVLITIVVWRFRRGLLTTGSSIGRRVGDRLATWIPAHWPVNPDVIEARIVGYQRALARVAADRRRLALAVGWSALGWATQAVALWVAFIALGVDIPVYVPFFVVPIGTVASAVPTPGGLGGIESVNVGVLALVTDAALAPIVAAVTIHSVGGYVLSTVIGAVAASFLEVQG